MTDAREIRRALAALARAMNRELDNWQRLSVAEHVGLARLALDDRDLAGAALALLFAIEVRERDQMTRAPQFGADDLARRLNSRRA
jgi:hypothetical protein